jgi:muconate cycloisomerase
MRIISATIYEVRVPARAGVVNSEAFGPAVFDEGSKFIVEAQTDEGPVGLGETLRGTTEAALTTGLRMLAAKPVEQACFQEPAIVSLADNDMFAHQHPERPHRLLEYSFMSQQHMAVHAVLLDLAGKKVGWPVHRLLGGAYRERVRVDYWMGRMTPEDSARVCRQARAAGYRGVKCKCALEDDNVARAQAVKEACGAEFMMTFDPNERFYRPAEALPQIRGLAAVGNVGCLEDPFPKTDLASYQLLRQQSLLPIALHIGYGPGMIDAVRLNACDYINLRGLPWEIRKGGDLCWAANIPTWHGSGVDLGILEALYLHNCAATKSMTRPSDIFGRTLREHNLISDAMTVEDGFVQVPNAPGLGVELDRDALERYTQRRFSVKFS